MVLSANQLLEASAADFQASLHKGDITSVQLVEACLAQIQRHDEYLRAIIAVPPLENVIAVARRLDQERANGLVRSALHGVPVLIKDNIATDPDLGMDTTAGSLALVGSRPPGHSEVVKRLIDAGAIVIAKANLSEFAWYKSPNAMTAWSAVGGQTRSPYISRSLEGLEAVTGDNNPGGSSCGPTVGVAAGYAPVAIGTETNGSLTMPAQRAALYTLKPTIGIVSIAGIVPISKLCDSAGPIAKTAVDIAQLMDILVDDAFTKPMNKKYESALTKDFRGLRIGCLDPHDWVPSRKSRPSAVLSQMQTEVSRAYAKIRDLCDSFMENVVLISPNNFNVDGVSIIPKIFEATFREEIEEYLAKLESSEVRSLADIIRFNTENAQSELPHECPDQEFLETALRCDVKTPEVQELIIKMRDVGRTRGLDKTFQQNNINVLIGPGEGGLSTFAAAAGYPICALPLTYLDPNGRPYGLEAVAAAHDDALLIQLMSAWEANFPARRIPASVTPE